MEQVSPFRKFWTKFNRAKEQLAKGNLEACLANFCEAIRIKLQGSFIRREIKDMTDDLFKFASHLSQHKLYLQTYGPVTFVQGQEKNWLDFFQQILTLAEEESLYNRLGLGQQALDRGELEKAREIFDQILEDFSQDAGVAVDIGDRYMDAHLYAQAEQVYRRAMALDPNTIHILNRLAISLRKEQKLQEAANIYVQAIKLQPGDEGLYYNAARVVYEMDKIDLARKLLTTSLARNPDFEPGRRFLDFLQQRGQNPAAGGRPVGA